MFKIATFVFAPIFIFAANQNDAEMAPHFSAVDRGGQALILAPIIVDTPAGKITIYAKNLEEQTRMLKAVMDLCAEMELPAQAPEIVLSSVLQTQR